MGLTKVPEFSDCASRKMTFDFPFKPSHCNQNWGKKLEWRKKSTQRWKEMLNTKT